MARYFTISLMVVAAIAGTVAQATEEKGIEWLFVQNAQAATLEDGVLTLEGVRPPAGAATISRRIHLMRPCRL